MLTDEEREQILGVILKAESAYDFRAVDAWLVRDFPNIETGDMVALFREAGRRQLAEADALEAYQKQRHT